MLTALMNEIPPCLFCGQERDRYGLCDRCWDLDPESPHYKARRERGKRVIPPSSNKEGIEGDPRNETKE